MRGKQVFREITDQTWDPRRRIEDMDRTGVSMQVLSTVPVMFSYWAKPEHGLDLCQRLNDHISSVVRDHPQRFAGLGTVPLQDPDLAAQEVERCRRELGLHGIEIGTHVDANVFCLGTDCRNLDHPSLDQVWSAAEQTGAAIFVHPWDMLGKQRMPKYWLPWLVGMPAETSLAICSMMFGGVFTRFPRLRVAFAHGGGGFPFTIGRIDHAFHARPDLVAIDNPVAPRDYLARTDADKSIAARFFVDSLVFDPDAVRLLLKYFGPDRVALGSDYPFPLGEAQPGRMVESMDDLSGEVKAQILGGSARDFLRLADP